MKYQKCNFEIQLPLFRTNRRQKTTTIEWEGSSVSGILPSYVYEIYTAILAMMFNGQVTTTYKAIGEFMGSKSMEFRKTIKKALELLSNTEIELVNCVDKREVVRTTLLDIEKKGKCRSLTLNIKRSDSLKSLVDSGKFQWLDYEIFQSLPKGLPRRLYEFLDRRKNQFGGEFFIHTDKLSRWLPLESKRRSQRILYIKKAAQQLVDAGYLSEFSVDKHTITFVYAQHENLKTLKPKKEIDAVVVPKTRAAKKITKTTTTKPAIQVIEEPEEDYCSIICFVDGVEHVDGEPIKPKVKANIIEEPEQETDNFQQNVNPEKIGTIEFTERYERLKRNFGTTQKITGEQKEKKREIVPEIANEIANETLEDHIDRSSDLTEKYIKAVDENAVNEDRVMKGVCRTGSFEDVKHILDLIKINDKPIQISDKSKQKLDEYAQVNLDAVISNLTYAKDCIVADRNGKKTIGNPERFLVSCVESDKTKEARENALAKERERIAYRREIQAEKQQQQRLDEIRNRFLSKIATLPAGEVELFRNQAIAKEKMVMLQKHEFTKLLMAKVGGDYKYPEKFDSPLGFLHAVWDVKGVIQEKEAS